MTIDKILFRVASVIFFTIALMPILIFFKMGRQLLVIFVMSPIITPILAILLFGISALGFVGAYNAWVFKKIGILLGLIPTILTLLIFMLYIYTT